MTDKDDMEVKIRGTVLIDGVPWMKLTEDIGGLTMVGRFIRSEKLTVIDEIKEEK